MGNFRFAIAILAVICNLNGLTRGSTKEPLKLRMITWNVADNSGMPAGFDDGAIDQLLGKHDFVGGRAAEIFAIGLQEQCWQCNEDEMMDIPLAFLKRLNNRGLGTYDIVGVEGTRESNWCEMGCKFGTHGTTALFVIARRGLVTEHKSFHRNDGCSDKFPENDEKGVAYMRFVLSSGKSVCVATSHLESKNPKTRRQCLNSFFSDAKKNLNWHECDYQFISGDFNTRTAASAPAGQKSHLDDDADLSSLRATDEMTGSRPYGRDDSWNGNLLKFINTVQSSVFKESPLTFLPTYKVAKASESCDGKLPCYRTDRPQSWTDRILHTAGTSLRYDSIHFEFADHYPVFEEFQLS